ncbi:hypothetical protein HRI_002332900 [Hibiscus trionum]|uniref:Uncharacterized protein n=1 Tax=Hibiscus trionum TaxID=183268 RepID=A0A9W7I127_HIBTR|nr:hypothetical protein HRI_002332900 [Hibiscus trionum]
MGKLKCILQKRVKNLYLENQVWLDLALTNEAMISSLQTNLEQVLVNVCEERHTNDKGVMDLVDDIEFGCKSGDEGWRKIVNSPQEHANNENHEAERYKESIKKT